MDRIAEALIRLADALDRSGHPDTADTVDRIARRAATLLQTRPKGKEEFLGHIIESAPGNLVYIRGPLLAERGLHALLLADRKREIERRHGALEELSARLPKGSRVERAPDGGPVEIVFPGGLVVAISDGTVSATADPRDPQASALAKALSGKPADSAILRTIGREAPRIIPAGPPAETAPTAWRHPAEEERPGEPPPDKRIREWAALVAAGNTVRIPAELLVDEEDTNTHEDSPLKTAFRAYLERMWENRPNFFVHDSFDGTALELSRRDRETDIPMAYRMERGRTEEEWLRIPDTAVRTDEQIERGTNRKAPTLKAYLDAFKARTTEVACTQVVDKHYTLRRTWEKRFGIVLRGVPAYICHQDANSDYDWFSGRKIPEKTPEGSKKFAKDRRDRLEAFIVPAKCSIPKIFVGPAFYRQGEVLKGEYEVGHDLAKHDLGRQTKALELLNALHMDWSNNPSLGGEPPAAIRLIRPRHPGVGRGSQLFVTPEIAEWVQRNHGVFLGLKQLWDKASAVLAIFSEKPGPWPAKAEGFHGIDAISLPELPKVSPRDPPPEYADRPIGEGFESCAPSALQARVIRETGQPFAIVEWEGKVKIVTTGPGFAHFRRLLTSPLCGKQPSKRTKRVPEPA